ncbi:nucleoporin Nup120/160-domain-containing protein [Crucibulum laeve]|uniref:Nucleoporin Nup120/160-domain-containing protein n=1 Tax=Crucibulum laeve TaxID=68775 RepID=A0A5C3MEH5_9AGAR|nr:nucleoporin Nup120/160-domain-containing protein [Crucibulum laeve]
MEEGFLVAAQLSSLYASHPPSLTLQTTRPGAPLPPNPQEADLPSGHATYSCTINTPTTGSILLRLLHGGLIIELVSLSTQVAPIRFVFPAVVLPAPSLFLWENSQLHILAVTDIGSLYRIPVPVNGIALWQNEIDNIYPNEYHIKNFSEEVKSGLVHAQGIHCIAIGVPNGNLLRLESEFGYDEHNEEWTETLFQHSSFLSSLTSFLPTLHGGNPNSAEIISMATHPWPTDIGHVWTLSRDRTLRLWKAKIGCVASKSLSLLSGGRESSPGSGMSGSGAKYQPLLDAAHQTLLRVFSIPSRDDRVYVVVFIPTPSASASGGSFRLIGTHADQLYEIGAFESSRNSAHCHLQDFALVGTQLYTLWDRQGRSMVDRVDINFEDSGELRLHTSIWHTTSYIQEQELTPAFMEEQLLSPGSLTEKFFEAIMRPGVFSSLTLRTAIEQYTDACLSLPGSLPSPLTTTYNTIGENIAAVVGCTVTLNRDPQTGALQHANYWTALKRDWEGFLARCREVERSARWPLALGLHNSDEIIVVERERVGAAVKADLPTHLRRVIEKEQPFDRQYDLLNILWTLRSKLGPQAMTNLENQVTDLMHQEIAFSFAEILKDQARRSQFRDSLDEGSASWLVGRLQSIEDLDAATRTALDIIGGFDMEVKREEEEVELLLPPSRSEWSTALTTAYITTSVDARYDLCLSLITLLFFLSEELGQWDASLLAEVFALFRGVAMLRYVASQPAGEITQPGLADDGYSADDVVSRMRNMNVSNGKKPDPRKLSLIHLLLAQSTDGNSPPAAAHRFLDSTGLLQSISPAHATKFEVQFCERLRLLGFNEVAREVLSWLPRTPGATYVLARIWLNVGRADDASQLLQKLAGAFGPHSALTAEDQESFALVLPATQLFDSEFSYYLWVTNEFRNRSLVHYEVAFAQLAISVAPSGVETSFLWHSVFKGYMDLGLFDDAYAALMAMPYDKQKRDCASQLAIHMCEENAVQSLVAFDFAGISEEVEAALSFKSRNVDPRLTPSYSRILYTWFIQRGDYRNASLTMYQRARKLEEVATDASVFLTLAADLVEALSIAINALSLVDQKTSWILMPISPDSMNECRKRQKLSRHIPEAKYTVGRYDAEIVHLADMQYDYALLCAQIDIIKRDPTLLSSPEFLLPPSLITLRLVQANQFNLAMSTARSLKVDMTDLFTHLTRQCLRLSRNSEAVIQEDTSDWLLTDKVSSWPGTPADRGWRYLRQSLERQDSAETDYRYSKATLETILSFSRASSPPPWLINILETHHPEYLIRVSLRYENLEDAVNYTLSLIRKSDARLAREPTKNASATWLPYTLIDQVLVAATAQDKPPSRLSELRMEVTNRMKRVQKFSQARA